jgi:hypothetical protein
MYHFSSQEEGAGAMAQKISRYSIVLHTALWLVFGCGCSSVPQREFKSYSDAFAETASITEKLLLEYDLAKRTEAQARSSKTKPSEPNRPYPAAVSLASIMEGTPSQDPVDARYEALRVVTGFNALLISLAEGKKPEEVRSTTDSLIDDFKGLATLVGKDLEIPCAGQVSALISTVITKLQEADNRRQFIGAMREAEPIIQGILDLFIQDAEDIYAIKAKQADRLWSDYQDGVATLIRQMKAVCKECRAPAGDQVGKWQEIEEKVRQVYDRAGLKKNDHKLPAVGDTAIDELTTSQLEQTLVQANAEADKYEAVIRSQVAFHELVVSYGQLVGKTKSALTTVRLALDAPVDIRQQAHELLVFAFEVKRDWEALEDARHSAEGDSQTK